MEHWHLMLHHQRNLSDVYKRQTYDREHMKPVIRASICTGEEVAGFKDIRTGKIEEIMLIRSPEELERFKEIYEITEEISKEY